MGRGKGCGERKCRFIKLNMADNVKATSGGVKTTIARIRRTIPEKHARSGAKRNFMSGIGTKKWKTKTAKNS